MSIFTIHYSHPNDLPFSINKVRHMAVATAMSRSHSWGMIKSRFAFYSSWFLLHLEQAEFMPRYQQTWQQHSWGRGPMPRRRAQLYGAVRNRETARYSLFWCFTWRSSRRGCMIHLCHFAATSLVTDQTIRNHWLSRGCSKLKRETKEHRELQYQLEPQNPLDMSIFSPLL